MAPENIRSLLTLAARRSGKSGIIAYPLGSTVAEKVSYRDLQLQAERNEKLLAQIPGFDRGSIVLLHFSDHLDNIVWFWSVILAGGIPAMSTPFTNIPTQRQKHLEHLYNLLEDPICITRLVLLDQFSGQEKLRPHAIENLSLVHTVRQNSPKESKPIPRTSHPEGLAFLMLTSGSTGNAKAVCLNHNQILAAVAGKSTVRKIPDNSSALNWIGFDHVANLTEIHLEAMYLGIDQIHVQASDVIADPLLFLKLIDEHRVGRTFAPNFFLAKLREQLEKATLNVDLSCLQLFVSGGEANVVETCEATTRLLGEYGAPPNVISAAFGMTETCAGSIYNLDCPHYDIENNHQFASLGHCIPGMKMRVTIPGSKGELPTVLSANEPGLLEVKGPVVFKGYFNNAAASAAAFTPDGWFKTGDQATIDSAGNLNLVGRMNETIIVNGVKHLPNELEAAIEEATIEGLTPSYTVCFPFRSPDSQTEEIFIVYLPRFQPEDASARITTRDAIVQVTMLQTGSRPSVLPLNSFFLQKSTLGKLSRFKIRAALQRGDYKTCEENDREQILAYNASHISQPTSETECLLQEEFCDDLGLSRAELGIETPIFEWGVTSIHLIRLKKRLQSRLAIPEIPLLMMMKNSTIKSLSAALDTLNKPKDYDPVVLLQPNGEKTPIWLFHPGVGEVLVFLGLAKFLPDRPVYAIRARGFEIGELHFGDINEAVTIYHAAIKAKQPKGPYALAGYSYGTMLAFETAKVLEANGDEVAFLGSFNLPPHIKERMQQLDWTECLLHLSYFLGLITAKHSEVMAPRLREYDRAQALKYIEEVADPARLLELALSSDALENWANLSFGLQSMARDYEPTGAVAVMDVFFAEPLEILGLNKADWVKDRLSKWADFCRSKPRFHEVMGEHYTMIGEDHVLSFQKTFRSALENRGL